MLPFSSSVLKTENHVLKTIKKGKIIGSNKTGLSEEQEATAVQQARKESALQQVPNAYDFFITNVSLLAAPINVPVDRTETLENDQVKKVARKATRVRFSCTRR